MKTLNLTRPVYLATSIVLALVVVFLLFSQRRESSFKVAPEEVDTHSDNYRRATNSTRGEGITPTPHFDDAPEASTRKKQRIDFKNFKATEAEIQHFYQPASVALLESSAEYERKMLKVFDDLGLGDYKREADAIIEAFVDSLTRDELIYYLKLGADGDHAALDKFRQERGFYLPGEARLFPPPWKKWTRKRFDTSADTEAKLAQSDPSPHDDGRIVESDVKRSFLREAQMTATSTEANPQALQHPELITLPPERFEDVSPNEEYNPETTLQRLKSDLPSSKTPQSLDDLPATDPEPPAQRERQRKTQRSRHAPYGDDTRE